MTIVPKEKPSIFEFRKWISFKLVAAAQRIYPESDAVKAFYLQLVYDNIIYGQAITRINPEEFYKDV